MPAPNPNRRRRPIGSARCILRSFACTSRRPGDTNPCPVGFVTQPSRTAARRPQRVAIPIASPPLRRPWFGSARAALRPIPIQNLLPGPEHDAGVLLDVGEGAAEIFEAVRRAHDV